MIKDFIKENSNALKRDLASLVKHNSIYARDAEPFGQANREVLDTALTLMQENGLKCRNLDYYCGYGEIGAGAELIGILAHLDIVPAGEGWHSDPFTLKEEDGILYGRGVSDDKGAVIAALYALKYLQESGYKFKKRVRLIVGCNEESGSKCIAHYVEKEGQITMGFTPDGSFPGIYGEKGMVFGKIVAHSTKIIALEGGDASNIVCKKVDCAVPLNSFEPTVLDKFLKEHGLDYHLITTDDRQIITVNGKAAHASMPDAGKNALAYLFEALYQAGFEDELVEYFHNRFALYNHGELFGAARLKDEYGDFTMNIGMVGKVGADIVFSFDSRVPVTRDITEVEKMIRENLTLGNNVFETLGVAKPLFFDQKTPFVQALLKAYIKVTGEQKAQMEVIGGGTYAKAIANCIAFGCEFPGSNNHIHDVDERLALDDLYRQIEIYVEAIKNLNEV